jgi:hypothetical protein
MYNTVANANYVRVVPYMDLSLITKPEDVVEPKTVTQR